MTTRPELEAQARREAEEKYPPDTVCGDAECLRCHDRNWVPREAWASARLDHLVDIEGRGVMTDEAIEHIARMPNEMITMSGIPSVVSPSENEIEHAEECLRYARDHHLPPTPDEGEVRAMANTWVGTEHGTHKLEDILTAFALHVLNTPRS